MLFMQLAFGSDWPVVEVEGMLPIYAAVHRKAPTDPMESRWAPEESIDVGSALKLTPHGLHVLPTWMITWARSGEPRALPSMHHRKGRRLSHLLSIWHAFKWEKFEWSNVMRLLMFSTVRYEKRYTVWQVV